MLAIYRVGSFCQAWSQHTCLAIVCYIHYREPGRIFIFLCGLLGTVTAVRVFLLDQDFVGLAGRLNTRWQGRLKSGEMSVKLN